MITHGYGNPNNQHNFDNDKTHTTNMYLIKMLPVPINMDGLCTAE